MMVDRYYPILIDLQSLPHRHWWEEDVWVKVSYLPALPLIKLVLGLLAANLLVGLLGVVV